MSKILILAEKPSVGKELAKVLGLRKNIPGGITGDKYTVTWALGHLVTLAEPEAYGDKYKDWNMETLPMLPERMKLKVIPETSKQYKAVKNLLLSPETSSLIIATDAGREGELVARWIIEKAGFKKPIKRLWISSQTEKAIKDGFKNLKDGRDYLSLYASAQARAEADWYVGLNVTRALTVKHNAQLSAGRVQTPTLALITAREEEIRKFVPRDYWNVRADVGSFFVTYRDEKGQTGIFDKEKADDIAGKIKGKAFSVSEVKVTGGKTPPPMLYDLTELQRDANKLYGFSAKQTLNIMQSLYEHHKALSYPRTDSRYLTDDIVPTLGERLKAVSSGDFGKAVAEITRNRMKINPSCVNNKKVSDHHAIIPTEQAVSMFSLSAEERKIYNLVVKRFLICFYPDYEFNKITAYLKCGELSFAASGREVVKNGWRAMGESEDESEAGEQKLPKITKGQTLKCEAVQIKAMKTTPPPRYTEASLLSVMENPGAYIKDSKMKEFIGGGLGTPATRADIIEKLFNTFYIEKRGKEIFPTSKGIQLIKLVPSDLREPLLTAKWESRLTEIKEGKLKKDIFISDIKNYSSALVSEVAKSDAVYKHDNLSGTPCPDCGKMMLAVNGKRGKMLVCQDRECGLRQKISIITGQRCPTCHKVLELFGEGDGKRYICSCGFREKESEFRKRFEEAHGGVSKKFVNNYLKNQSREEPGESALAAALRKAMEEKKK